jgi:hypothetical protein
MAHQTAAGADRPSGLRVGALALELFVVFVGVYAAFALTDWDRRRHDDQQRERLRVALLAEVRGTTAIAQTARQSVQRLRDDFESRRQRGERPVPSPVLSETRADPNVWNATVAAGGIELIDVGTFVRLARYYNAVQAGLESGQALRRLSEQMLVPRLGERPETFYREDGVTLRPEYRWYPDLLAQIEQIGGIVVARGDSIVAVLESGAGR